MVADRSTCMLLDDHIAHCTLAGYRPSTLRHRRQVLETFGRHIDPVRLEYAGRTDIERFLGRPNLSPETRRAYRSHLRAFYRWAIEEGLTAQDPTERVPAIRVHAGTPRPISDDDLRHALRQADPRMRAWLLLMALAGLRCMEVAGVRPADLTATSGGVLLHLRECKGGGTATMPLHPQVVEALLAVPIRNGQWWDITPHNLGVDVARYLRSLGIDRTAHTLRHWAGTNWFRASGHDLLTTAALLRHVSVKTTQVYAQLDPVRPAAVVGMVADPTDAAPALRSVDTA